MAQDNIPPAGNGQDSAQPLAGVSLRILAQYTKDLSFENPSAPNSLFNSAQAPQGGPQPTIEVGVDVAARRLAEVDFESELRVHVKAMRGGETTFLVELVYSGLFRIEGAPPELLQPLLLIEAPRLLFPFARRIVADVTRDGGFLPLMIDPVDFASLYRQQMEQRQGQPGAPTALA